MGDFHQTGVVTTLHNLVDRPLQELEGELSTFAQTRPLGLVLPSLYSELQGPALEGIVDELTRVPYLSQVVIGLDRADRDEARHAVEYFSRLPQPHRLLWNDGPRLLELDALLKDKGLAPTELGKGRNVWYCFGYVQAAGKVQALAVHDCDILTYERGMLARLIYPVAHPRFNYQFCKGYYARVAQQKLKGRVSRLLVTPLIKALKKTVGHHDYLEYLDGFRYPLSGEISMRTDVLSDLRIPSDWGLEIGTLSELHRNYMASRLCQVDIASVYDHKHQSLSADNPDGGLSKMSTDICKAVFRKLATKGTVLSAETFRTVKATYYRSALDLIEAYADDALINGLSLDRHEEEEAVEVFSQSIMRAGDSFLANPMETPFIPAWRRVLSALPDFFERFSAAVEADNAELQAPRARSVSRPVPAPAAG